MTVAGEPVARTWESPTFSVVIAAYDAERWNDLGRAVAAVAGQRYAAHETIVAIDNNPALLQRVRDELPSVLAVANNRFPGAGGARNAGSAMASGDVLAFIDDDVQPSPGWLESQAAAFRSAEVIGVGGTITPRWLTGRPWWFPVEFDWVVGCTFRGSPTSPQAVRNLIAANMSVRRGDFEALAGFRDGFGKVGTRSAPEETDFCIRAGLRWRDRHWLFLPEAEVMHSVHAGRTTVRYFLRRCWMEGTGKAALASLVGAGEGTRDERRYVLVTLPTGLLLYLGRAGRRQWGAVGQAAMLVAGLVATACGYAFGRTTSRWPRRRTS